MMLGTLIVGLTVAIFIIVSWFSFTLRGRIDTTMTPALRDGILAAALFLVAALAVTIVIGG